MTRYLDRLSSPDIAALSKDPGVVVLPVGATEQHGAHLPVMTDTRQVVGVLGAALELLDASVNLWCLPALPYSKSNEHDAFAGTVSLSAATLTAVLGDVAASVRRAGFKRLAFLNGHGGNAGLLEAVARDVRYDTGLACFVIQPAYWLQAPFSLSDEEQRLGVHAGELETSLMLALEPALVDPDKTVKHYPEVPGDLHLFGSASVAWLAHDWSVSGVFGDATLATPEKGEQLLQHAAERLAHLLTRLSTFEVPGG